MYSIAFKIESISEIRNLERIVNIRIWKEYKIVRIKKGEYKLEFKRKLCKF
jgi:hypothetical protein